MSDLLNFPPPLQGSALSYSQTQNFESQVESTTTAVDYSLPAEEYQPWVYDPTIQALSGANSQFVGYEQPTAEDQQLQANQRDYAYRSIYSVEPAQAHPYLTAPTMQFPTPSITGYPPFNESHSPVSAIPPTPSTSYSPEYPSPFWDHSGSISSTPTTPLSMQPLTCTSPEHAMVPHTSQTQSQLTYPDQVVLWKKARELPSAASHTVFVAQKIYKPHTTSDIKRYVEEVALDYPIYFWMDSPEEVGISLIDALHGRTKRLRNRDKEVFEGRGPSVSIRLEWPGYRQWSRQIPTKDFKSPPRPINMTKLCKNVAKCVQRFISERQGCDMEDGADPRWRVGDSSIRLDDLVLVSLHHVSMGSWQPQLRLRPRIR